MGVCGAGIKSTTDVTYCHGQSYNISNAEVNSLSQPYDWTNVGLFVLALMVLAYTLFVFAFKPHYKRLEYELEAKKSKRRKKILTLMLACLLSKYDLLILI